MRTHKLARAFLLGSMLLSVPSFAAETFRAIETGAEVLAKRFLKTEQAQQQAAEHLSTIFKQLVARAGGDEKAALEKYLKSIGDEATARLLTKEEGQLTKQEFADLLKATAKYGDRTYTPEMAAACGGCFSQELRDLGVTRLVYNASDTRLGVTLRRYENLKPEQVIPEIAAKMKILELPGHQNIGKTLASRQITETDRISYLDFLNKMIALKDKATAVTVDPTEARFIRSVQKFYGDNTDYLDMRLWAMADELPDNQLEKFTQVLEQVSKDGGSSKKQRIRNMNRWFEKKAQEAAKNGDNSLMEAYTRMKEKNCWGILK